MARIRTIKPEFPQSQSMGRVSREARLCFLLMWTLADDSGRLRGNSRMLASLLYPYDDDAKDLIDGWMGELEAEACIYRYEVEGDEYIEIRNWLKHQKIDRPTPSKTPGPEDSLAKPREPSRVLGAGSRIKDQGRDQGRDQGVPTEHVAVATVVSDIEQVFTHWATEYGKPRAKLDAKRRRAIGNALKAYTVDDLLKSVSGYKNSPHHMGQNDRRTVYDDIELMLRDAKHVDAGLNFYANPPRTDLSERTLRIVSQTENWVPPELRNASN